MSMNSLSTCQFGRLLIWSPRISSTQDVVSQFFDSETFVSFLLVLFVLLLFGTKAKGLPYLDLKINWPNDIYLDGLKVGGILCTSTYKSKKFNVSAGIGLNVDNGNPTAWLNAALRAISSGATYQLRREETLASFFNKFERLYGLFINEGKFILVHQ